jgi:cold shock CspA family protein
MHRMHQVRQSHQGRPLERIAMQGVIKAFDPSNGDGIVVSDTDLAEYDLAPNALEGSIFRMLRQGQRVVFILDASGRATSLSLGSESDMGTPIV